MLGAGMGPRRVGSRPLPAAPTICPQRATNHLDAVPKGEPGSEGFAYRHGHHRLLAHQPVSQNSYSTTTKDTYRLPQRVLKLGRGEAELPTPEPCVLQKGSEWVSAAGLMAPFPPRAAGGHAGVNTLPEIQVSPCLDVLPIPEAIP